MDHEEAMSQNYGALRVVHVSLPTSVTTTFVPPEEQPIHLLTCREVTVGRALSNDLVLIDPTVSREHARLVLDQSGWHIINVTKKNVVRVNGRLVPSGGSLPIQSQDIFVLGSTLLQLIDQYPFQPIGIEEGKALEVRMIRQCALSSYRDGRMNRLVAGIGGAILASSILVIVLLGSMMRLSTLTVNGAMNIFVALIIPLVPTLGIVLLTSVINRFEPKPRLLRLAAFLWGAVVAVPMAFFLEPYMGTMLQGVLGQGTSGILWYAVQAFNPGAVEESIKGLGLFLLFLLRRDEFDNVIDGAVYGILIGAGFALVENFWYFVHSTEATFSGLVIGRVLLGWLLHSTFTACSGIALGYARHVRVRWREITILLVGYLLAVGLHAIFNFVVLLADALLFASPVNSRSSLFSLLATIGGYIPPYVAQIGILYVLMKAIGARAGSSRKSFSAKGE